MKGEAGLGSEKKRLNDSLVLVSQVPLTMAWRNNTGMAWQGDKVQARSGSFVQVEPGMVILKNARPITFGLPGSGDILGVTAGQAWALEIKDDDGAQSDQQGKFQAAFERAGGRYCLSRSPAESRAFVDSMRKGW